MTVDAGSRSFFALPLRLFRHISRHRRLQYVILLGLTFASALAEVISLGAVVPFIGILVQPEKVFASPTLSRFIHALGITSPRGLVVPLAIAFAAAAVLAGAVRLALAWFSIRVTNGIGADLSIEVYRRTLYQPYTVHVSRSSSEVISSITQKVATTTGVLGSLVSVVISAILFVAILLTLLAINPMVATIALFGFGVSYAIVAWLTRKRLKRNSVCIAQEQTRVVKALQEGLGAIRDVLLDGTQEVYSRIYGESIWKLQLAVSDSTYLTQTPRFAMEALGMVLIALLTIIASGQPGGVAAALPALGALALGAQRLLPLMQVLYSNWSGIATGEASVIDVIELLEQPLPDDAGRPAPPALRCESGITLDNVRFRYTEGPIVLDGINLTIRKGSRVGFIGTTGSGKSTALDLVMGLLEPTQGRILVDGRPVTPDLRRAWQASIAHVPQNIFLSDATIAENIAFGVPRERIDYERVRDVARKAQVAEFIESRSKGYNEIVGERGIRLSGGQRQRIGIARALYKQAQILVFDEATSALDSGTESAVMSAINDLDEDITVLIVAHRLTTLRHCDVIVQLERGQMVAQGSYAHFARDESIVHTLARTGS